MHALKPRLLSQSFLREIPRRNRFLLDLKEYSAQKIENAEQNIDWISPLQKYIL